MSKFKRGIHGLSEDMEEFMLEQGDHYSQKKERFWTSFYETCINMWTNGVDLTEKQLHIITREYNKVKKERVLRNLIED